MVLMHSGAYATGAPMRQPFADGLVRELAVRADRRRHRPRRAARSSDPRGRVRFGSIVPPPAAHHDLAVTAVDVDPDEIRRAREKAARNGSAGRAKPEFLVADVARMPFDDGSFDLVVSTFSMHHWEDKQAGLAEVWRVLRPGSRALIWDTRRGFSLFHLRSPDPLDGLDASPLELRSVTAWAWPFGMTFFRRLELARPLEAPLTCTVDSPRSTSSRTRPTSAIRSRSCSTATASRATRCSGSRPGPTCRKQPSSWPRPMPPPTTRCASSTRRASCRSRATRRSGRATPGWPPVAVPETAIGSSRSAEPGWSPSAERPTASHSVRRSRSAAGRSTRP